MASADFVLILVQKLIAHAFQDLQVLTGGIGVRLRKEFHCRKLQKQRQIYELYHGSKIQYCMG